MPPEEMQAGEPDAPATRWVRRVLRDEATRRASQNTRFVVALVVVVVAGVGIIKPGWAILAIVLGPSILFLFFLARATDEDTTYPSLAERAARLEEAATRPPRAASAPRPAAKQAPPPAQHGVIAATLDADLPAVARETVHADESDDCELLAVTAQPFVVETAQGPWLVDTAFIEVTGRPVRSHAPERLRQPVTLDVGDKVFLLGASLDPVPTPPWVAHGGSSYRERTVTRLAGTAEQPIQIMRVVDRAPSPNR